MKGRVWEARGKGRLRREVVSVIKIHTCLLILPPSNMFTRVFRRCTLEGKRAWPFTQRRWSSNFGERVSSSIEWARLGSFTEEHHSCSCVDGRETVAVLGTPGGDTGDMLVLAAAAEFVLGRQLEDEELKELMEASVEEFGPRYMHTDEISLAAFSKWWNWDGDLESFTAFLQSPPLEEEERLLEGAVQPQHIGCGFLGLTLLHSSRFLVRHALAEAIVRTTFKSMWRDPSSVQYRVLQDSHREKAVMVLRSSREGPLTADSMIPMVQPCVDGAQYFVHHPGKARWIREQRASRLKGRVSFLEEVELDAINQRMHVLANRHNQATRTLIAPDVPVFAAYISYPTDEVTLVRMHLHLDNLELGD